MSALSRTAFFLLCAILVACAKEPFGEVAKVTKQSASPNDGWVLFEINKDFRELTERHGYTIYGSVSVHSLGIDKPNCSELMIRKLPYDDVSRREKQLYEAGWVPIHNTAIVSYRRQDDVIIVKIDGSSKETRCTLPRQDGLLRVHIHFLGNPMPFGSSDEGMLGLDVIVPARAP